MKKFIVLLVGMFFCLHNADAQFPLARHFWLNPNSYNHTLSPTSDGGYILAAARQERGANLRNTIAVFKLDTFYNIQNSRIIGLPGGADDIFDVSVNFEVHDVTENIQIVLIEDEDGNEVELAVSSYVICGSISHAGTSDMGMVAIVDAGLNTQSIRDYPDAEVFYSVRTKGNYYYVCGKTPTNAATGRNGIVLWDELFTTATMPLPTAYITNQTWEYHKVILNNNGNDIVVSGTDYNEIGFTAFDIIGGGFAPIPLSSQKFSIFPYPLIPTSKVVVANNPNNLRGLILSVQSALSAPGCCHFIHTYLFSTYSTLSNYFRISNHPEASPLYILEDMNTAAATATFPNGRIAWVGNATLSPNGPSSFYISADLPFPTSITYIAFPTPTPPIPYFALYKVHYNPINQEFHCGGFYNHSNNNKTTFVVQPEQAVNNGCGTTLFPYILPLPQPNLNPLNGIQMRVRVNPITWHDIQYNFCDTDCVDAPLNNTNNSNCGNN